MQHEGTYCCHVMSVLANSAAVQKSGHAACSLASRQQARPSPHADISHNCLCADGSGEDEESEILRDAAADDDGDDMADDDERETMQVRSRAACAKFSLAVH